MSLYFAARNFLHRRFRLLKKNTGLFLHNIIYTVKPLFLVQKVSFLGYHYVYNTGVIMQVYLVFLFGFFSMMLSACLTIGCAEREDRVIDQSDNCCPSCYNCEPKVIVPHDQIPSETPDGETKDDGGYHKRKSTPNITIIIDNKNKNTSESDSDSGVDSDIDNTNNNTNSQCTKQYNMVSLTEFEMTKKCEKKPPCHGKGKWKKYNGHYVLNYTLNSCDDLMLEQIPCTE